MGLPSKQELKGVIVSILTRARDEGRLSDLTVRIVLREVARHYGIEEDVFQSKTYKPFIKETVFATLDGFDSDGASDENSERPEHKEDGDKLDGTAKAGKRKRKPVHSANEDSLPEPDISESETPPKKASARSKPSKPAKLGQSSKKPESESKYKSKAIIESSDEEVAESGTRKSTCSPKKGKASAKTSPRKQKQQKKKASKVDSDVEMDTGEGPGPSSPRPKPKPATESPKSLTPKTKELPRDPMESELSSVIDEPPTKRKKKQEKESTKPQKDEKAKRGKKEALSKDEETVNRLKSIVLACGVRKVWKKEFEGLNKPSQQIKRLHSILNDLGMTPRYSLEKAKTIKERRELAQELKDVQEFDKAIKRRGKGPRVSSGTGESDQDDSDADVPIRKKQNARASIMAFLQDQSEEE